MQKWKKIISAAVFAFVVLLGYELTLAESQTTIAPNHIVAGEVTLGSAPKGEKISSIEFEKSSVPHFFYNGRDSFLIGVDLKHASGTYPIRIKYENGNTETQSLVIAARRMAEQPLGIPGKLGGNTTSSQNKLIDSLASENNTLADLKTNSKALWSQPFIFPISDPIVTDQYGYIRQTGAKEITHKGTDFRAAVGTKITAMDRGIVRLARNFRIYGKTVVIDHGQGVQTFYMHLSKIKIVPGQLVSRGQLIGLSGQTGYAENPHLHVSVHINHVSVDPIKFLELFQVN